MSNLIQFKVFIERIEGQWAILETLEGDSFHFPLSLLPESPIEGSCLAFTIENDPETTQKLRKKIKTIRYSLKNN